jgi:predicted HD phosphohydrolase
MNEPLQHFRTAGDLRAEIGAIYLQNGERAYGLYGLNQLQHALQSADRAERMGMPPAMIIACLLHDVGHMIHHLGEAPAEDGVDDRHEELGARWTAERFPPAVSEPIRLHVAAKRYLCSSEPGYIGLLAKDSLISLELQGGLMSEAEITSFLAMPYAVDAVELRRIDELAKDKHAQTRTLYAYLDAYLEPALAAS